MRSFSPSFLFFSSSNTRAPFSAADPAAIIPEAPPPTTIRSYIELNTFEVEYFVDTYQFYELWHVRHQYHRSFVRIECLRNNRQVTKVNMVRWFVEYKQSRFEKH